jgi:hypothetical protein
MWLCVGLLAARSVAPVHASLFLGWIYGNIADQLGQLPHRKK